jgi:hypothetical protein
MFALRRQYGYRGKSLGLPAARQRVVKEVQEEMVRMVKKSLNNAPHNPVCKVGGVCTLSTWPSQAFHVIRSSFARTSLLRSIASALIGWHPVARVAGAVPL